MRAAFTLLALALALTAGIIGAVVYFANAPKPAPVPAPVASSSVAN